MQHLWNTKHVNKTNDFRLYIATFMEYKTRCNIKHESTFFEQSFLTLGTSDLIILIIFTVLIELNRAE